MEAGDGGVEVGDGWYSLHERETDLQRKELVVNEIECVDAPELVPRLVSVVISVYSINSEL